MLSLSKTRHLVTFSSETKSHVVDLEFPDEDSFCGWLKNENEIVECCLTNLRSAPNLDLKLTERLTERTSERRRLNDSETTQLKSYTKLSPEKAVFLVRRSDVEVGEAKYSEVVMVKTFTNDG